MEVEFLEEPRQVTSAWHYLQAKKWLEFDEGRELDSVLVYACLELRAAIERFWLEIILTLNDGKLGEKDSARCRTKKGLESVLKGIEPKLRKWILFSNKLCSYDRVPQYPMVEIKDLIRTRSKLSQYCHFQMNPYETWESTNRDFQRHGFSIIKDAIAKLGEWFGTGTRGLTIKKDLPEEVKELWNKYSGSCPIFGGNFGFSSRDVSFTY
jgi:hypothetical protein